MVGSKRRSFEADAALLLLGQDDRRVLIFSQLDREGGSGEGRVFVAHVALKDRVPGDDLVHVLGFMDNRWQRLKAMVTEVMADFSGARLEALPVDTVLFASLEEITAQLIQVT